MSYLNPLRIHFAGEFVAAPSTVNNDIRNYSNLMPANPNRGWNEFGDAGFSLTCPVTSIFYGDESQAADGSDPALSMTVQSLIGGGLPQAKIVDLDPDQQGVSMLFGLQITLAGAPGTQPLFQAQYVPAPFTDLWSRRTGAPGDESMTSAYQSVLNNIIWGNIANSRFLTELKAATEATASGALSIRFIVDGYSTRSTLPAGGPNPKFTHGRLVGTIGPVLPGEPLHFVRARQLHSPAKSFSCPAVVDTAARKIRLDLGNVLSMTATGAIAALGRLKLIGNPGSAQIDLGEIDYSTPSWYEKTAGVVVLPTGGQLTDAQLNAIDNAPLALQSSVLNTIAKETDNGIHVRADLFVARMNPADRVDIEFWATKFGQPLPGAVLDTPPVSGILSYPPSVVCDATGKGILTIQSFAAGNPRGVIDGQVLLVAYGVQGQLANALNQNDFLSILAWDAFTPDNPITWLGSIKPILEQYANLYPIMKRPRSAGGGNIDLGDYNVYCNAVKRAKILDSLRRPITDPRHMPVTRDLSEAKRQAIIQWLTSLGPDGNPRLGTGPVAEPQVAPRGTDSKFNAMLVNRSRFS